ncbi:hypothetical protein BGX24_001934 [Mortierella sp. AD032]|nr:hypothetical protein BGX24_001934 [Mortierella sp. AD032]
MRPILRTDYTSIYIFDIPLILDLICGHLTKDDLWPCLQVSRYWHDLFKPQTLRYVRFADLKKHQTWTILNNAARVHCLTIDIADARWFLDNPHSPCINLRTLRCVDFGYMKPQDYNVSVTLEDDGTQPTNLPVDPRTNALNLVQLNPKLTTLEVIYQRQRYCANHLTPSALVSISKHQSLSLLKIDMNVVVPESFLVALLQHLPLSLEDLSFTVDEVWKPYGALPVMTGLTPHERTNLRRITLRPCTMYTDPMDAERHAHGLILPLLQHSPRLVDLSLSRYGGQVVVFLQTLAEFCPLVETIDHEGQSRASAEVVTLTGSLSHLREFRLLEYCRAVIEEQQLIPNFLRRSSATLEVISFQADQSAFDLDTTLSTAAWNFWPECPRLREYTFVLDFTYEAVAPDRCIDTLVELLSRPTVACWNLEKLELCINDHGGYEECTQNWDKSRSQDTYDHQQNFLQLLQPLYRCLRSFKRLHQDNLRIFWAICKSISMMNLDEVLPRINGHPVFALDTQPPGLVHTRSSSNSNSSESESSQLKEPEITRRELNWMGLVWASGSKMQQQTEKTVWTIKLCDGEHQNRDLNAGTAWARSYKRVGCEWKDWEGFAGLRGCVPDKDNWRSDCDHEDCLHEFPDSWDEGYDRILSGYYIEVERGHRRRSMQRFA